MYKKIIKLILALIVYTIFITSHTNALEFDDEFMSDDIAGFGEEKKFDLGLAVSGFACISNPKQGYQGYRTNPCGGGDVRLLFRGKRGVKFYCALAGEYFPLAPPKAMADFEEDIFSLQGNFAINYLRWERYIPYFGVGIGYYWDTLSQKIRNFGSKTNTKLFSGFNGHLGFEYRISPYISLTAQYKYHFISQADIYATVAVYSVHTIVYIGRRLEFYD